MSDGMIRFREAIRKHDVSKDTLRRWIKAGMVGRGGHGKTVYVCEADIERIKAPRYARPAATTVRAYPPAPAAEDWRRDELWKGAL